MIEFLNEKNKKQNKTKTKTKTKQKTLRNVKLTIIQKLWHSQVAEARGRATPPSHPHQKQNKQKNK